VLLHQDAKTAHCAASEVGPLCGLKFPSFPRIDFANFGALRPLLLG